MGDETIVLDEEGKPLIKEDLCIGCGICVNKCPYDALQIINLPEALKNDLVHQFGPNSFRLYRFPIPKANKVIGLLGQNGIGKTTTLRLLSGELIPNHGNYRDPPDWSEIIERYKGTEHYAFLSKLAGGNLPCSIKKQDISILEKKVRVKDVLDLDADAFEEVNNAMALTSLFNRNMNELSGGELQRVAIAKAMLTPAKLYLFDEPSSYLDIYQRLNVAKAIRELSKRAYVLVVEHDLAVIDFLADQIHLIYGSPGAFGIVTNPYSERHAINTYLSGWLREENIRFGEPVEFIVHPAPMRGSRKPLVTYTDFSHNFEGFTLEVKGNTIHMGEVIGVVGPNAIGKTTYIKILAGILTPTSGKIEMQAKVSYKPQYLKRPRGGTRITVEQILSKFKTDEFYSEILHRLGLNLLRERPVSELSGGELQLVANALCLLREADIYMLDEPSSYLDSNQRLRVAKTISWFVEKRSKAALVVDHDVYFIDLLADSLIVFSGEPSKYGAGEGPFCMRDGMNKFLRSVEVTFRRDPQTNRPRVNKPDSRLDREQKSVGEYYYQKNV
jgi:ATP-binding cassette subfamily E protein 1